MSTAFDALYTELAARLNDPAHDIWTADRVKACVNGAICHFDDLGGFVEATDETTDVVADGVEYELPDVITDPSQVVEVSIEPSATGIPWTIYGRWSVIANAGVCTLILPEPFPEIAGSAVRIVYLARHPALADDDDETDAPAEFIYAWGQFLAHNEAAGRSSQAARQQHLEEAKRGFDLANAMAPSLLPRHPAVRAEPAEQ
jgi:hypothetical protein